jgi:agmatine deiminase
MNVLRGFKTLVLYGLTLVFLISSCKNRENLNPFYHPPDFASTAATYFVWADDYHEIISKLIGIISAKDKVTIFVGENNDELKNIQSILEDNGSNLQNIEFVKLDKKPSNVWIRDFGPVFLINKRGEKKIVDFNYFGKRQTFNKEIGEITNLPVIQSDLNSTGGAREVNGKGTIILCEAHELDVNKSKTKQEIEQELTEKLDIKKVIWLKRGIPQDDNPLKGPLFEQIYPNGVNGHVDEFCRFTDEETILISSVSESEAKKHPILAEAKKRLDENYEILRNSTDQDGNKFRVIKVPFAPLLIVDWSAGEKRRLVASVTSYMNFIITNSFVILPSYISSAREFNMKEYKEKGNEVMKIFQEVFPSRQIIPVPAADLNHYSGGFHCISINEPLVKK